MKSTIIANIEYSTAIKITRLAYIFHLYPLIFKRKILNLGIIEYKLLI